MCHGVSGELWPAEDGVAQVPGSAQGQAQRGWALAPSPPSPWLCDRDGAALGQEAQGGFVHREEPKRLK